MTLPLPGIDRLPVEWTEAPAGRGLSQWFTPDHLALRVAVWGLAGSSARSVLEPSAGAGALVKAIRMARFDAEITAIEIDPTWAAHLRALEVPRVRVLEGDALDLEWPTVDAVVLNPPYECGRDGLFLERAMRAAPRVAALVRLSALAGIERHDRVWSQIGSGPDQWSLTGLAICAARPGFREANAAETCGRTDFCAVRLERSRVARPGPTVVEWWV